MGKTAKAVMGALVASLTALGTSLVPAVEGGSANVTPAEWVAVVLAGLVAYGAVWATPNTPDSTAGQADDTAV